MWQSVLKAKLDPKPFKVALKNYIDTLKIGDVKTVRQVQKEVGPFYREELINDGMKPGNATQKVQGFIDTPYVGIIRRYLKNYPNIKLSGNAGGSRRSKMEVIE